MTDRNAKRQSTTSQEIVVVRTFQLPLTEAKSLQAAIVSNMNEVARVAATGGVQGIKWVSPEKRSKG